MAIRVAVPLENTGQTVTHFGSHNQFCGSRDIERRILLWINRSDDLHRMKVYEDSKFSGFKNESRLES